MSDSNSGDQDLLQLIEGWRDLWALINSGDDMRPHVLGAKLRELNDLAHRIAAAGRSRGLTFEELSAMTEVELLILRDQLASPLMHQAV